MSNEFENLLHISQHQTLEDNLWYPITQWHGKEDKLYYCTKCQIYVKDN